MQSVSKFQSMAMTVETRGYELLVGATVLASVGIMAADYQYAGGFGTETMTASGVPVLGGYVSKLCCRYYCLLFRAVLFLFSSSLQVLCVVELRLSFHCELNSSQSGLLLVVGSLRSVRASPYMPGSRGMQRELS